MRAAVTQGRQRGLQGGGGGYVAERADPATIDRPVSAGRVGVEDVREVDIADQVGPVGAPFTLDREAGVAGGGDELLDTARGDVGVDGDQGVQRESDRVGVGLLERERAGEQLVLVGQRSPSSLDSPMSAATESRSVTSPISLTGVMRSSRSTPVATAVRPMMSGRKIWTNTSSGGASIIAARSGPARARFFGTISPSSMCSAGHQGERDRERDRVDELVREMQGFERSASRAATAGSRARQGRVRRG